jgi:hypothetical protein
MGNDRAARCRTPWIARILVQSAFPHPRLVGCARGEVSTTEDVLIPVLTSELEHRGEDRVVRQSSMSITDVSEGSLQVPDSSQSIT